MRLKRMTTFTPPPFRIEFGRTDDGFWSLKAAQWVPSPLEDVFDFFQRPANLERITPPGQKMRIEKPFPEIMSAGDQFTYRLQVLGIPLKWQARIESITPPHAFTDMLLKGPYRAWIHTHRFESHSPGTLIHDDIRYKVYGCRYGNRLFYQPQLEKIFRARAKALEAWFSKPPESRIK